MAAVSIVTSYLDQSAASFSASKDSLVSIVKEGALHGREFEDHLHTFSCLAVLHNAVVAWNTLRIGPVVEQLRSEGWVIEDADLSLTSPLLRKHINPFGKYHFDLERMRRS
jgi:hypothetical protein